MITNRHALIVAGGSGVRMGSDTPKQFIPLRGLPIIMHTLNLFHSLSPRPTISLVLPANQIDSWHQLCAHYSFATPHSLVEGGKVRFFSVKNGLDSLVTEGLVAIHDGVRPLVSRAVIEECFRVAQGKGNAIPVIKPTETVRFGSEHGSKHVDRQGVWLVQTPQVFRLSTIKCCYQCEYNQNFTDDASVAEASGEAIHLVEGNRENIKITTPVDLVLAEALMGLETGN